MACNQSSSHAASEPACRSSSTHGMQCFEVSCSEQHVSAHLNGFTRNAIDMSTVKLKRLRLSTRRKFSDNHWQKQSHAKYAKLSPKQQQQINQVHRSRRSRSAQASKSKQPQTQLPRAESYLSKSVAHYSSAHSLTRTAKRATPKMSCSDALIRTL